MTFFIMKLQKSEIYFLDGDSIKKRVASLSKINLFNCRHVFSSSLLKDNIYTLYEEPFKSFCRFYTYPQEL